MASSPATFAFADIAGFTALTEAHGDEAAFELVAAFSRAVMGGVATRRRSSREDHWRCADAAHS
jgi:class 3 adenylate cyclase